MRKLWIGLAVLLSLGGCRQIDFQNGEIPAEYVDEVQALVGTYEGFLGYNGYDLKLSMQGNRPRMELTNRGEGPRVCNFQIGNILSAQVNEVNGGYEIRSVIFNVESKTCALEGNSFELRVRERGGRIEIDAFILEETRWERRCTIDSGNPPYTPPREICNMEPRSYYLSGEFVKTAN